MNKAVSEQTLEAAGTSKILDYSVNRLIFLKRFLSTVSCLFSNFQR